MKLLFVDLDDTLLNSDKSISKENLDAIDELLRAGHGFVINTGRPLLSAQKVADEYGFRKEGCYISAFNGSSIVKAKDYELIYSAGVNAEYGRLIFDKAISEGIHVHTYAKDCVVAQKETEMLKTYCDWVNVPYKIVPDAVGYVDGLLPKIICADLTDHEMLENFRKKMAPLVEGKMYNIFSNPRLLEFGSLEASKGLAIEKLAKLLGVKIEDTVGAGDEENDIEMIKTAGTGVAMVNGINAVKEVADYITVNDNNNAGIAEVIHKFIL